MHGHECVIHAQSAKVRFFFIFFESFLAASLCVRDTCVCAMAECCALFFRVLNVQQTCSFHC
jgi:hypothetical protein